MANRYWVGGTAAWDGTAGTKWALTSGGAGGQAVPTSADDVFFDAASGAVTCTITGTDYAKSINCTGFTGTLTGSGNVFIYGNVTFSAGMNCSATGLLFFSATATIISAGKTFFSIAVNAPGITVTLSGALTLHTVGGVFSSAGTLNLNGFTITAGYFNSNSPSARSIAFGSANILINLTVLPDYAVLNVPDARNLTWTGTGGFVRAMASTAKMVFGPLGANAANAPNLTVNSGANALTITGDSWFNNLIFTGSTSTVTSTNVNIAGNLTLASGGTYTALAPTYRDTGILTSAGKTLSALTVDGSGITVTCADALTVTDALTLTLGTLNLKNAVTSTVGSLVTTGTTLKYLQSTTAGSQATISDTSGTNTVTYLSIKDSNATGGAVFDATDPTNVNVSNNTGWLGFGGGDNGSFIAFFM